MKKVLILLLFYIPLALIAQDVEERAFLLDKFEKGKVIYKKGGTSSSDFNYDIINEEVLFTDDNSEYLKLLNPSIVATVVIGDRHFEHIRNGLLYEKIEAGDDFLYVRWKSRVISEGKTGLYGTKATSAATQSITAGTNAYSTAEFKVVDNRKLVSDNRYYLKQKNKFKEFNSFKALAKLFKENQGAILEYVNSEKLDFQKIDDVKKAVAFCFQD